MGDIQDTAVSGVKKTWCTLWNFTVNTARRTQILGRYAMACGQQQKIKEANASWRIEKTFQALERGEANPLVAPEVSEAVQKAKEAKEDEREELPGHRGHPGEDSLLLRYPRPQGAGWH